METSAQETGPVTELSLGSLISGVSISLDQAKAKYVEYEELAAQVAALNQQIETLSADKMAMEADLEDKDRALEDLNIQIESLNEQLAAPPVAEKTAGEVDSQVLALSAQVADLQGQLDAATAAKADLEQQLAAQPAAVVVPVEVEGQVEALNAQVADLQSQLDAANAAKADLEQQLAATQGQLGDLTAQVDNFKQQVETALSPEELADLQAQLAAGAPAAEGEPVAEGEAKEGPSVLGLAALAGGVTAAVHRSRSRADELDQSSVQLTSEKADLEAALQEKDQSLASFNEHLLSLQGQVNELASEKSTADVALLAKEQELADAQAQIQALQARIDELTAQFDSTAAEMSALQTKVQAAAPLEQAVSMGERLAKLPAVKQSAAGAALVLGKQPVLSPKVQALTQVAGIGSVRQQKLYNSGVGTFWELSNLDNDQMKAIFGLTATRLQRVDFDETRASARQLADETDTVGLLWDGERVDDMEPIAGIGRVFEQRLYAAGITTYDLLAASSAEQLADIIQAPEFNQPDYGLWLSDAKALVEKRAQEAAEAPAAE
jgi:predicted flap endonuclease-1-like 5' DNA nuclease